MMQRSLTLVLIAGVFLGGSGCVKRIRSSSYIVHDNLRPTLGIGPGGTLYWVAADEAVPEFKVVFTSPSPCVGGLNNLPGTPNKPAHCRVTDSKGVISFVILPMRNSPAINKQPSAVHIYARQDGCSGCAFIKAPPPQLVANPDIAYIECDSGQTKVNPPIIQAAAHQEILWYQVGQDTVKWEVSGSDVPTICGVDKVGTLTNGEPTMCVVQANAPIREFHLQCVFKRMCSRDCEANCCPLPHQCSSCVGLVANKVHLAYKFTALYKLLIQV